MLELTLSRKEEGYLILGIENFIVKYKKENREKIKTNPLNIERVVIYSKNWDKEISKILKIGFYPIIIQPNPNKQYYPGEIIEIKNLNNKPNP